MGHVAAAKQISRISFKIEVATQRLRHSIQQAVIVNHLLSIVFFALCLSTVRIIKHAIVTLAGILRLGDESGFPALFCGVFVSGDKIPVNETFRSKL